MWAKQLQQHSHTIGKKERRKEGKILMRVNEWMSIENESDEK